MANTIKKFLTYDGLATVVKRTASAITGVANTDSITLSLHGKETVGGKVGLTDAISDVIIPLANKQKGLAGLMSAAQSEKLDSIVVNNDAEANQNAYSNFAIWKKPTSTVADVTLNAASTTDTLIIKAGTNIELSATNDVAGKDILTIANTYSHPTPGVKDSGNLDNQLPKFGGTVNYIKQVTSNSDGHVAAINTGTITMPELPNVTVTDKGNTTAANAGNTIVKVVKAVSDGTNPADKSKEILDNTIYLDYTTVEVPTKGYVDSIVAASNAMVLKGEYSGRSAGEWANTTTFSQGDTFVSTVSVEDTTLGKLEAGDLIIAKIDGASKSTKDHWIVVQKNVDIYDGTAPGLVPPKGTTAAADASKYLNQTGNWTVPAHLGIKVNDSDVYTTTTTGTFNLKAGTNLTITKGTEDKGVTPVTFAVDMTKVAEKGHKHTITANGTGDSWISVTPSSGELGVTYAISHNGPGTQKGTYEATATGSSSLVMGTSCVVTGVKYDEKGHIVGITSGKLPTDKEGITSVDGGTGITVSGPTSGKVTVNLDVAAEGQLGGIAIGYAEDANNFAVKLDSNNKAYVTIPEISEAEINALFTLTA
jgi:hypothetical protein